MLKQESYIRSEDYRIRLFHHSNGTSVRIVDIETGVILDRAFFNEGSIAAESWAHARIDHFEDLRMAG